MSSYRVGFRHSSDLALLWLWCRLAAAAPIWSLAWEHPYATDVTLKRFKKKEKPLDISRVCTGQPMCVTCVLDWSPGEILRQRTQLALRKWSCPKVVQTWRMGSEGVLCLEKKTFQPTLHNTTIRKSNSLIATSGEGGGCYWTGTQRGLQRYSEGPIS